MHMATGKGKGEGAKADKLAWTMFKSTAGEANLGPVSMLHNGYMMASVRVTNVEEQTR